jgi:molybdopterin-guanine dinucleotide biosynthesis protein A
MVIDLSAAVLAGGRSSRMGFDKAFLNFNGRLLIREIAERLAGLSDDVMVVVGTQDVRVLKDSIYTMSPIGGIITAAINSHHSYFAAIATDMPFVDVRIIERLRSLAEGHSAAVPVLNGRLEPLCSVYSSNAVSRLEINGLKSVRDMIALLPDAVFVNAESLRKIDPELRSFKNVNTMEEYLNLKGNDGM